MKIRLPSLANLRGGGSPPPPPVALDPTAPVPVGSFGDRMRLYSRRLRGAAGWVFLAVFVFLTFVWLSLPTRAIAWRMGQQARQAGYVIDIEDMSLRPWGSATLYNVTWTYSPSHPGQVPHSMVLEAVDVDFAVLKYLLFGTVDVTLDTVVDDAPIHAEYLRSSSESTIKIEIAELPLMDVPKLQQALGAPLRGLFAVDVDLTLPENLFEKAEGHIAIECSGCSLGDGESLLFIPGSSGITAQGITIPEIDLGTLSGKLVVKEGKATAENFNTKSDDIELMVTGEMALKDPFSKSDFAFDMKLLVTPALQEKSETLRFAVQTAGPSSKMDAPDEGWLGFKLRGSVGRPRFMGIKSKTAEERMLERRQKNAEREAAKKARSKTRTPAKKDPADIPEKDSLERNTLPDGAGDTSDNDNERRPEVEVRPVEPQPSTLPSLPEPAEDIVQVDERPEPEPEPEPQREEPARGEPEGGQGQGEGDGRGDGQGDAQGDAQAPAEPPQEGEAPPTNDQPTGG